MINARRSWSSSPPPSSLTSSATAKQPQMFLRAHRRPAPVDLASSPCSINSKHPNRLRRPLRVCSCWSSRAQSVLKRDLFINNFYRVVLRLHSLYNLCSVLFSVWRNRFVMFIYILWQLPECFFRLFLSTVLFECIIFGGQGFLSMNGWIASGKQRTKRDRYSHSLFHFVSILFMFLVF